jgi:hypothetical protein
MSVSISVSFFLSVSRYFTTIIHRTKKPHKLRNVNALKRFEYKIQKVTKYQKSSENLNCHSKKYNTKNSLKTTILSLFH